MLQLKKGFNILLVVLIIGLEMAFVLSYWYFIYKNFLIASTGIRDTITYQGKISNSVGVRLADGEYKMRFKVYDAATSGTLLWTENWDYTDQGESHDYVTIQNGFFAVELNSLCGNWTGSCASNGGVNFNSDNLYLQVELDSDSDGSYDQVFSPRKRFSAIPYAMNADKIDSFDYTAFLMTTGGTMSGDLNASSNIKLLENNLKLYFNDYSSIYYNGSDLMINPQETGSGDLMIASGNLTLTNNQKINFGDDYSVIYSSGSDLIINPKNVSRGNLILAGNLKFNNAEPALVQDSSSNQALSLNGSGYANGSAATIFNTDYTIVEAEFKPDFLSSAAADYTVFDTSTTGRYNLVKTSTNYLSVYAGGTAVISVSYANYAAYWNENDWNLVRLVLKTAGSSLIYLNNVLLPNDLSATYTTGDPANIYAGAKNDGSATFLGAIDFINIYNDYTQTVLSGGYDFTGNYSSSVSGVNNLTAQGTGNSFVAKPSERLNVDYQARFNSMLPAADYTSDFIFDTNNTRTAGNLLAVYNNNTEKLVLNYNGNLKLKNDLIFGYENPKISQPTDLTSYALALGSTGYASGTATGIFNTPITVIDLRFKLNHLWQNVVSEYYFNADSYKIYESANDYIVVDAGTAASLFNVDYTVFSDYVYEYDWNNIRAELNTAGVNTLYLNDYVIASNTTSWSSANPSTIVVGAKNTTPENVLQGEIDYLNFYSNLARTTQTEGFNFSNNYLASVSSSHNLSAGGTGNTFTNYSAAQRLTINYQTKLVSQLGQSDYSTDFIFDTKYRRSKGNLLMIKNNNINKLVLDYSGNLKMVGDNQKIYLGTDSDASITYDGTNMVLNPKEVGSGKVRIAGDLQVDGTTNIAGGDIANLKMVTIDNVSYDYNTMWVYAKGSGAVPDASNTITVNIPDGTTKQLRTRGISYLSGASKFTLADGIKYWGRPDATSSAYTAYLYAIWDGTGIVWALGGQ